MGTVRATHLAAEDITYTTTPTTATMNLDVYTQHVPLTQKARFWGNFVSALKGGKDLYAAPEPYVRNSYPSIVEYIPTADSKTKNEFGRLEDLMWRSRRGTSLPPTPVLSEANDRIHTLGYNYCPVHTEIYGSYRNRDRRAVFKNVNMQIAMHSAAI